MFVLGYLSCPKLTFDLHDAIGLTPAKEQKDWMDEDEAEEGSDEDTYEKLDEASNVMEAKDPGLD